MDDVKLEDLVGETTVPKTKFNIKPYLEDFFGGMIVGAIGNTVGQYKSPPTPPLSTEFNLFYSAVLTGLSSIPPFQKMFDQMYIKTNQNVWGGRFTRFTGLFTGTSLAYYFLR